SKNDWDIFEISYDFGSSPLINDKLITTNNEINLPSSGGKNILSKAYENYKKNINNHFKYIKENEEELNCIFIDIYGLQNELTPEVSDRDITFTKIYDDAKDIPEEIK